MGVLGSHVGVTNQAFLERVIDDVWSIALDHHIAYVDFTDFEAMGTQATEGQPQYS